MPIIIPKVAGKLLNTTHIAYHYLGKILRVDHVDSRKSYLDWLSQKPSPREEPPVEDDPWAILLEPIPLLAITLLSILCFLITILYCQGTDYQLLTMIKTSLIQFLNWCCLCDIPLSEDKAAQLKWTPAEMNAAFPGEMSLSMEPTYEGSVSQMSWQDVQNVQPSDAGTPKKKSKKHSRKRSALQTQETTDSGSEVPKKRSKKKKHS